MVKNPPASAGGMRHGFSLWVGKIPWRGAWQPTPVFLPGEYHGQRRLEGYIPWGCTESDTTEVTYHTHTHNCFRTFKIKIYSKFSKPGFCSM